MDRHDTAGIQRRARGTGGSMYCVQVGAEHGQAEVMKAAHRLAGDHLFADLVELFHPALLHVEGVRHPGQLQIEACRCLLATLEPERLRHDEGEQLWRIALDLDLREMRELP